MKNHSSITVLLASVGVLLTGILLVAAQSSSEPTPAMKFTMDLSTPPATPKPATTSSRRRQQATQSREAPPTPPSVPGDRRSTVTGTGSFRLSISKAVGVSASRVKLTGWEQDLNEIVADFYFSASSASGEATSTELATKLQYELFNKNSKVYAETLYPMHITKSVFSTLPPATASPGPGSTPAPGGSNISTPIPRTPTPATPAPAASSSSGASSNTATSEPATAAPEVIVSTPESSSSMSGNVTAPETPVPETPIPETPAPPTPEPPPTPVPPPTTPVPTPLAPREVINGSGILFSDDLEGEAEQTSTIWIVVMVCIGLLILIGIAVCLIKFCGREKKEERRVYGEHIK